MSTDLTYTVHSGSPDATERAARRLAAALRGGETIELVSDLGGGKTTFVRGLVAGLHSPDKVASPTFTISKVYTTDTVTVHHFDFFRLQEPGIMADEVAELTGDPAVVTIIEWADVVAHVLPDERLTVRIALQPDGARRLTFQCPPALAYILRALKG